MEKKCFKCGEPKPLEQFYRHPMMADGHLNKCKPCARIDVRTNRAAKREQYNKYDSARYRGANKYPTSSEEKVRAQRMVQRAVKEGRLTRPTTCERCKRTGLPIDGHHHDYGKPLDVEWLCRRCHGNAHAIEDLPPESPRAA